MAQPASGARYDWTGGNVEMSAKTAGSPGWWLDRLSRRLIARRPDMTLYADYYVGDHRLSFEAERLRALLGPHFRQSRVNYCAVVVDKLIERLEVVGFRNGTNPDADKELWSIWQDNALDQEFTKGLREAAIKGEFSLAIWESGGKPQIRVQDPLNVIVAVDPEDRRKRRAALKRWFDEDMGVWYATLYLPDRIWKFEAKTAPGEALVAQWWEQDYWSQTNPWMTWAPRQMPNGEPFNFANPLKDVPVIPFPNKPDLRGVGVSELRDVIPLQDKINKLNLDLLRASEFAAFPQKWATNVDLERDGNTGEVKVPWKIAVDRIITASAPESPGDPETKFGEFSAAQLSNWLDALEAALREVAVVASLPGHYLPGKGSLIPPSGEALRAAESGLTRKSIDRQRDYAEPLEIALRLAGKIAKRPDTDNQELETIWRDPEVRTESEHLNALVLMASLGVPKKGLWPRIQATPTEIALWEKLLADGDVPPVPAKLLESLDMTPQPAATKAPPTAEAA